MKADTDALDKAALIERLNTEYGLRLDALRFLPVGEEAYSYLGEGNGERYFAKAYHTLPHFDLGAAFRATALLNEEYGLKEVLPPFSTLSGDYAFHLGEFTLALFPYIEGKAAYEDPLPPPDEERLAQFFGELHGIAEQGALPALPREDFTLPYRPKLLGIMEYAHDFEFDLPHQATVVQRLREGRDAILHTLERLERLGDQARAGQREWVLTHGDPTSGNVMKDTQGKLYVIDWGDLAWGPRERDLVYYLEGRTPRFVERYLADHSCLRLDLDLFEFYIRKWNLQEIADYSVRLLRGDPDEEEIEYSLSELSQYLPVRDDDVQAGLRRIEADMGDALRKGDQ